MELNILIGIAVVILVAVIVAVVLLFRQGGVQLLTLREAEREARELAEEVARLSSELDTTQTELQKAEQNLAMETKEREALSNRGKEQFINAQKTEAALIAEREKNREISQEIAQLREQAEARTKVQTQKIEQLSAAQKALNAEQERLRLAEEAKQQALMENKQRIWDDHEKHVVAHCAGICAEATVKLPMKDNQNVPEGFGTLKPDVAVRVLGKWLVIDAKSSTAKRGDMTTYLRTEAKKAAEKYAKIEGMHTTVYFVVPHTELGDLRESHWREGQFDFFAVSVAGVGALLRSWKRMEQYAELTEIDPDERDAIVDLLARYQQHIDVRNAVDLHLMQHTDEIKTLHSKLGEDLSHEVETRRGLMSHVRVPTSKAINVAASDYKIQKEQRNALQNPQAITTKTAEVEAQRLL